jgi:hypothetical protein
MLDEILFWTLWLGSVYLFGCLIEGYIEHGWGD